MSENILMTTDYCYRKF